MAILQTIDLFPHSFIYSGVTLEQPELLRSSSSHSRITPEQLHLVWRYFGAASIYTTFSSINLLHSSRSYSGAASFSPEQPITPRYSRLFTPEYFHLLPSYSGAAPLLRRYSETGAPIFTPEQLRGFTIEQLHLLSSYSCVALFTLDIHGISSMDLLRISPIYSGVTSQQLHLPWSYSGAAL